MKKQILSALLAAAAFGVGCRESTKEAPPPKVEVTRQPKIAPPVIASKSPAPRVDLKVEEVVKDALALNHEDLRPVDHLARVAELREQGDLKGALTEARRALSHAPDDVDVLEQVERIARVSNDRALRLEALTRIARLRPDDATPLIQKARLEVAMKDFASAVRTGAAAAERDPTHPEVYQAIGRAHLGAGQLAPAIAMFQKVVQLDPNHGYALNNLGFAYLRANRNEDAAEVLARAAELLPRVAWVHNNLGVAMERLGRTADARQAFLEASFLSPKYVKAQVNIARVVAQARSTAAPVEEEALETEDYED